MSDRSWLPQPGQPFPTTDVYDQQNFPDNGPLRVGGELGTTPQAEENLPSAWSKAAKAQQPALEIVRDLTAGPQRIRDRSTVYLPKAPAEEPPYYAERLQRSVFFNVFNHTIKGLVGQVFRRNPDAGDDVPPLITTHLENIDLAGTHFDVFARDILQDALTTGHAAILVDFPQTGGQQNARDEMTAIRPYWVPIRKDDIVSWRTVNENGHLVLTQLVLKESTLVPNGMFGEAEQTRYRVLYRNSGTVGFLLLEVTDDKRVVLVGEGTYPTQTEIPVAEIATSGRTALFESEPPLLGLAYLNIAHYQQWSDYATSLHKTCVPILTVIGAAPPDDPNEGKLSVGPNTSLFLPTGGKAEYVSHSGQALAQCKQALDDLKSDMGTLGLAMLAPMKRTAETAQAKRLDKATEDSALAVTARGLQDGLERALAFHAAYLKLPSGGSMTVNKQFDEQQMAADMLTAWTGAVANAGIPARLMLDAMQVGELIDEDEDIDAIADEMAANQAAAQAQKEAAAADQLALAHAKAGIAPIDGKPPVKTATGDGTAPAAQDKQGKAA